MKKADIKKMTEAIGGGNGEIEKSKSPALANLFVPKGKSAEEIIATKKLEIPKCMSIPINGRIYVTSIIGTDLKTAGGLILPTLYAAKKNEELEGQRRYFIVAWDALGIPEDIKLFLSVGKEVNPFIPQDAEGYKLPEIIDWETGNIFEVFHYTELAGISRNEPKEVGD